MHRVLQRQLRKLGLGESPPDDATWKSFLDRVNRAYVEADQDRYTLERALDLSSAEMRGRFEELRSAQRQLVEASRKAGMAEVATNVLHNVGNVLNSLNVSTNMVAELTKGSAAKRLRKTLELVAAQDDQASFLARDPRGQKVVPYLLAVTEAIEEEGASIGHEVDALLKNVDHIKRIVSQQLAAARGNPAANVVERVVLDEVVEDTLAVLEADLDGIRIERHLDSFCLATDRHKVFQIVVNLLTNARDAVRARGHGGTVVVHTRRIEGDKVVVEVEDDGVGIAADDLSTVFQSGDTTKPNGHGLGLHASACAAMELGGSLHVKSPGPGHGASFTLQLPHVRHAACQASEPSQEPVS